MEITNAERAIKIRAYLTSVIMADGKTKGLNLLSERNKRSADLINIYKLIETSALEAMKWKDEQLAKEKQQLIDEACKWLFENDSYAIPTNVQVDRLREHLNNIK